MGEIDGVKFLAWKSDGVKFLTNSMSTKIVCLWIGFCWVLCRLLPLLSKKQIDTISVTISDHNPVNRLLREAESLREIKCFGPEVDWSV